MDENRMTELNKALEAIWESLTDEQKAKAKECKSMDELAALAGAAGVELPDEMLDAVAGGANSQVAGSCAVLFCPYCKRNHTVLIKPITTITLQGESEPALVRAFDCGEKKAVFYATKTTYYDTNGNKLGNVVASSKGC